MAATFLRETTQAPRTAALLARHPGALVPERLERTLELIWDDLQAHLANPIITTDTRARRVVEFFGCVRYIRNKRTDQLSLEHLAQFDGQNQFVLAIYPWSVDLPMMPNGAFLEHYLCRWWLALGEVLKNPDNKEGAEAFLVSVQCEVWRALRRSGYWKRLRYALREALAANHEVLGWCRHGRSRHLNHYVSNHRYSQALANRDAYAQIAHDNPNLIWLYTFMLDEKIDLPFGDPISGMKDWLMGRGVTPAGWRLMANGCERDFAHIRDWIGPEGEFYGRYIELLQWLRFLPRLRRRQPMRGEVLKLFLHDSFKHAEGGGVCFRNVPISLATFNVILAEAERRQASGSLKSFINEDLVEVMTWLETEQPVFDRNQLKAGWKCLARQAVQWSVENEALDTLRVLKWASCLPEITLGRWAVVPLTDAWQLREEALRQHHCADTYIATCLSGETRLFSVRNAKGNRVATIGIVRDDEGWRSFGIRGIANAPVAGSLIGMDRDIAERYTDVWRLAQPEPTDTDHSEGDTLADPVDDGIDLDAQSAIADSPWAHEDV